MDSRAWLVVVAGSVGTLAGLFAVVSGEPALGLVATLMCAGCVAATIVIRRRAETEVAAARHSARAREAEMVSRAAEAEKAANQLAEQLRHDESVVDDESGLLDHRVFAVTFERKLAAARRHLRPLSLVLLDLGPCLPVEPTTRKLALTRWGSVVQGTLRDCDVPCRVGDTTFGIILEDTPESGGVWVAERLQIAATCTGGPPLGPIRAAVATYPNHGLLADEVLEQGWAALRRAQSRPVSTADGERFGPVELPSPEN
jgi:GGDEF domain-containing protein